MLSQMKLSTCYPTSTSTILQNHGKIMKMLTKPRSVHLNIDFSVSQDVGVPDTIKMDHFVVFVKRFWFEVFSSRISRRFESNLL